jgi:hypothetical protein
MTDRDDLLDRYPFVPEPFDDRFGTKSRSFHQRFENAGAIAGEV